MLLFLPVLKKRQQLWIFNILDTLWTFTYRTKESIAPLQASPRWKALPVFYRTETSGFVTTRSCQQHIPNQNLPKQRLPLLPTLILNST